MSSETVAADNGRITSGTPVVPYSHCPLLLNIVLEDVNVTVVDCHPSVIYVQPSHQLIGVPISDQQYYRVG
jgi:hypothetical protein